MKNITDFMKFDMGKYIILNNGMGKVIKEKDNILEYMKSFNACEVSACSVYDSVENRSTGDTLVFFNDGEYEWDSAILYHFEKYNVRLNEEFISKVTSLKDN